MSQGIPRTFGITYGLAGLLYQKEDGKLRLVQDYRRLNKITIKNRYPLYLSGRHH